MAGSPVYKVYVQGCYVAACKDPIDAASLVGIRGRGAQVKYDHSWVLWTEGREEFSASDSPDGAVEVMRERLQRRRLEYYHKHIREDR